MGGGDNTLFFPTLPSAGRLHSIFFRHTVGSTHSDVLNQAGQRRSVRPFRILCKRMAVAEMQRWEIYLERRVQATGWDGQLFRRALRRLPRSVPQAHRWFLLKAHLDAPIASARLTAARVVDEHLQCCLFSCNSDGLDHLLRCQTVLDVYDSIRVVASLPQYLMDAQVSCC